MSLTIRDLQFLDWSAIALELGDCETICLRGESGSGKSLLLRAVADLIPNEGTLELDGQDREEIPPTQWRRNVAYLPAEILWWEDTVGAHFGEPPTESDLSRLRLSSDAMGWAPSRLSMGERQRLGIMRMLDRNPKVLLLDEPTANLDEAASEVVENLILGYIEKRSACAIWVTHSQSQAKRVGNRLFLMKGKSVHPCTEEVAWE